MLSAAEVRRRRVWGVLSVLVGGVLIFFAILAITGKLGARGSSDATETAAVATTAAASPGTDSPGTDGTADPTVDPAVKAPLTVLNGGGGAGLAGRGQTAFQAAGWEVSEIGNLSSGVPSASTVYYPADDEEAKAAAENLAEEFPALNPAEAPDGLGYPGVVVVLTGDWDPAEG